MILKVLLWIEVVIMILNFSSIVFLLIAGAVCAFSPDTPFSQHEHTYVRQVTDRLLNFGLPGYVGLVRIALSEISSGNLNLDKLNNFDAGLNQYYLLRVYEHLDSQLLSRTPSFRRPTTPISLSNVTIGGDTFFHNVQVVGFPSFEKQIYLYVEPSPNAHDQRFKIDFSSKSAEATFRGHFTSANYSHMFEYQTLNNIFQSNITKIRDIDGSITPIYVNETFQYTNNHLSTTASSLDPHLNYAFRTNWLPELAKLTHTRIEPTLLYRGIKYSEIYRKLILLSLIEDALEYIAKNNLSFEVNTLNFPNYRDTYADLRIDGILNFNDFKLTNSTWEETASGDGVQQSRLTDTLTLYYEAGKRSFISFTSVEESLRRQSRWKYEVKNMSITSVYSSFSGERPLRVLLNGNVSDTAAGRNGFLINFGLEDYDPTHEMIIRHVSNEIAGAVYKIVNKLL